MCKMCVSVLCKTCFKVRHDMVPEALWHALSADVFVPTLTAESLPVLTSPLKRHRFFH